MSTKVRRIDLTQSVDLQADIANLSDNMLAGGFRLAASFVYQEQLVLIYQKSGTE